MHVLLDGDIFRYRVGFACQHNKYFVLEKGAEQFGPIDIFTDKAEADAAVEASEELYYETIVSAEHISKCLHSLKLQISLMQSRVKWELQ